MSRCPYHRSDFCIHDGLPKAPATTTDDEPAAPVTRCSCGRPATVTLTYLPRPFPLFGAAVRAPVCAECYPETIKRGQMLNQQAIVGEG